MDVLAELLPSAHLVKAEHAAKDRKNKPRQFAKIAKLAKESADSDIAPVGVSPERWDQVERRSGEDRRQQCKKKRGRWLESRAEKDRRQQSKAIFVTI